MNWLNFVLLIAVLAWTVAAALSCWVSINMLSRQETLNISGKQAVLLHLAYEWPLSM